MPSPTNTPSLLERFNTLTTKEIVAFVSERRGEDLRLDFKITPNNFGNADERKVLAKTISAFANSSGGLIVWGIDARRDKGDDVDCAQDAVPLKSPDLFMSRLMEYAAAATAPPAPDVQHRRVDGEGGPFALTYVPESDRGPHMAKNGEDRYYQRSGGSSLKMEHYAIQDMFGRRPKPSLRVEIRKLNPELLVLIRNEGRGAAKSLFLALRVPPNFKPSGYGYDGNGLFWLKNGGHSDGVWRFGGDTGTILHAGQTHPVTIIDPTLLSATGKPIAKGPQVFRYEIAAEEIPIESGEITIEF